MPKYIPKSGTDLSVRFCGIELKNPLIAASGTFGYGLEFEDVVQLDKLGASSSKASRESHHGQSAAATVRDCGRMLNAIGLQNVGARAFIDEKLPKLREKKDIVVFANVFGYTRDDYERTIQILNEGEGIAAYELNVSCPNTAQGGIHFGSDPRLLEEVVVKAKRSAERPLIVKLSPNVTSIPMMARIAEDAGADAISLSTRFSRWPSTPKRAARVSPTSPLASPALRSNPSRYAWCMRRRRPSRFRSSAWAGSAPAKM